MTDVVGLYLNPPQEAIVLCVDEKSQIQALDRTQPGLPIKKGRCGTMTHDYKRNGTTTLFAALDTLRGKVVGECHSRHRHQEFLKFLRRLDLEFPGKVPLHLVMDNYGTHKHERVKQWLKRHPRVRAPPKDLEGLLFAGRSISGSHVAHAAYRVTGTCMAMGQAAGLAAAMAVKGGSTPSRVDGSELHAELVKRGAAFLRRVV